MTGTICSGRKHLGVIARFGNGWSRELNLVSWSEGPFEFDIRDWSPDHERMSRSGVRLDQKAMDVLAASYTEWRKENEVAETDHVLECGNDTLPVEVYVEIAALPKESNGFRWKARVVSWNRSKPKVDIRGWWGRRMLEGLTLTQEEADTLCSIYLENSRMYG